MSDTNVIHGRLVATVFGLERVVSLRHMLTIHILAYNLTDSHTNIELNTFTYWYTT